MSRLSDNQTGQPPLIAHVIHHLGVGGMENGLVNLINHIPPDRYRHAIVCLKGLSETHKRIARDDVDIVTLNKREGKDLAIYPRLFKTLKRLQPDIVHTRNLGTMEGQVVAAAAGIRARIHGEHGRDIYDLHGTNIKYNILRKAIKPFVGQFIAVSRDLESWLASTVGVARDQINQIYSGVDGARFHPRSGPRTVAGPEGFFTNDAIVIGSVGRMAAVKDYPSLVRAFAMMIEKEPAARARLRLLIVGDGVDRHACMDLIRQAGLQDQAWFPGERSDIAELMRGMDVFVLPSLGEGISNTILEAMCSGLPVVATRVGGNVELVRDGVTGTLVPPAEPGTLAGALLEYYRNGWMFSRHGKAARQQIESSFTMDAMAKGYLAVYDKVLEQARAGAKSLQSRPANAPLPQAGEGRGV
jgi:sugar transferase (PEP-CTERM/EpsH1 system associated)